MSKYLTVPQMKAEIERCLQCPNKPCQKACPVACCPQDFIAKAKAGDYEGAVQSICQNNPLGQTCGLICPDNFCMKACVRRNLDEAIRIPKLQATLLEKYRKNTKRQTPSPNGLSVAVMGAGPAGLAAAEKLSSWGYEVTIFEQEDKIGGALNLIPSSRLPFEVIKKDGDFILSSDLVKIYYGMKISSPQVLLCNFDAVIVATGEPNSLNLNIEGEDLLLTHLEYLKNPNKYATDGNVAIIGGGAVATDCAVTAKQLGATNVEMFVRRRLSDMRVSDREYQELLHYEIDITTMTSPEKVEQDGETLALLTARNELVDGKIVKLKDSVIRRKGFKYIIKAVGSRADKFVDSDKVFYAGDCKNGGSTIVEAIASGQQTAYKVHNYLTPQTEE